jgi:hypothetical protein
LLLNDRRKTVDGFSHVLYKSEALYDVRTR